MMTKFRVALLAIIFFTIGNAAKSLNFEEYINKLKFTHSPMYHINAHNGNNLYIGLTMDRKLAIYTFNKSKAIFNSVIEETLGTHFTSLIVEQHGEQILFAYGTDTGTVNLSLLFQDERLHWVCPVSKQSIVELSIDIHNKRLGFKTDKTNNFSFISLPKNLAENDLLIK